VDKTPSLLSLQNHESWHVMPISLDAHAPTHTQAFVSRRTKIKGWKIFTGSNLTHTGLVASSVIYTNWILPNA
jgi:hypothetical protein